MIIVHSHYIYEIWALFQIPQNPPRARADPSVPARSPSGAATESAVVLNFSGSGRVRSDTNVRRGPGRWPERARRSPLGIRKVGVVRGATTCPRRISGGPARTHPIYYDGPARTPLGLRGRNPRRTPRRTPRRVRGGLQYLGLCLGTARTSRADSGTDSELDSEAESKRSPSEVRGEVRLGVRHGVRSDSNPSES